MIGKCDRAVLCRTMLRRNLYMPRRHLCSTSRGGQESSDELGF